MKLLLDACAISELRREDCAPAARLLVESVPDDDLFISAITVGELQKGISLLEPSHRKQELERWLITVETLYGERILPVTRDTAVLWGDLTARCQQKGHVLGAADGLIAATAIEHGLHVLTRNSSVFEPTGALVNNPWR